MASHTTCTLANLLLNTAIRDESINSRIMHLSITSIEPLSSKSCTDSKSMSLAKRTRSILYATYYIALWVTRCNTTPLAELLELLHGIMTCHAKLCVEHWRHVTRIKEETVSCFPTWVLWIMDQELGVKYLNKVCSTH